MSVPCQGQHWLLNLYIHPVMSSLYDPGWISGNHSSLSLLHSSSQLVRGGVKIKAGLTQLSGTCFSTMSHCLLQVPSCSPEYNTLNICLEALISKETSVVLEDHHLSRFRHACSLNEFKAGNYGP